MTAILQHTLPEDMREERAMPGLRPVEGDWLRVDEAYAGQMARRTELLATQRADVLDCPPLVMEPAHELLDMVVEMLPRFGFGMGAQITCPDGRRVTVDKGDPLGTLGHLVQCDFCLLEKVGEEHVLQGAVLCFPASWTLSEKIRRPLGAIHDPVQSYDANMTRRVQRLFDGVQPHRPIWRFNRLGYESAELHQPRRTHDPNPAHREEAPFVRLERQTMIRLPKSRWVVFAIHSFVLARKAAG